MMKPKLVVLLLQSCLVLIRITCIGMAFMSVVHCQESAKEKLAEFSKVAMRQQGDVQQGKNLFVSERLSCSKCHTIDGTKSQAPDLSMLGEKFGRREIIDSVLTPSARIAEGYETSVLLLNDGHVVSGVIKNVDEQSIQLLTNTGSTVQVSKADIETQRTSPVSLMPEGLMATLTTDEFKDLIEFLVSLKHSDAVARITHGMPDTMEELASPVEVRPIIGAALKFDQPVWFGNLPGARDTFWVIEHQVRRIWRLQTTWPAITEDTNHKTLFLDLGPAAPNEGRLAGLAFHPKFRDNRKYYLLERTTLEGKMFVTIVEREVAEDGQHDSGREPRLLLKVPQTTGAHFGGWLDFGPDGFLYISFGDSGPQEDPNGHAQNRQLFLGKIIRIDVDRIDGDKPYSVPPDNPFVNDPQTLPEIWALGLRAPWRLSFDRLTGDLWAGDVGQDRCEEVNIVRRGENFGWNVFEGFETFSQRFRRESEKYVPPIVAYSRKYGPSVTGGFVYRADPQSPFYGKYIFGDYESRRIFAMTHKDRSLEEIKQIGLSPQRIVSFGQDLEGNLYVVGYDGLLYRIDFTAAR